MEPCATEYLIQAYFLHERGAAMPNIINLDIIEEALNFYGSHKDKEAVDVLEKWYEEAKRQHERTYRWDKDRVIPKRVRGHRRTKTLQTARSSTNSLKTLAPRLLVVHTHQSLPARQSSHPLHRPRSSMPLLYKTASHSNLTVRIVDVSSENANVTPTRWPACLAVQCKTNRTFTNECCNEKRRDNSCSRPV